MLQRLPSAEDLRTLIEDAGDGFFLHDTKGRILDVNAQSCRDLGYSRQELLGLTINDISCGASPAENLRRWKSCEAGNAMTIQETAVRKDGTTFPVEIGLTCQIIVGRKLLLGFARDVSAREASQRISEAAQSELERQVEERTHMLRATTASLQAVMDSAHDAIVFQDIQGRFQMFNRSAERLTGWSQAEALGKDTLEVFGGELGRHLKAEEDRVMATGQASMVEQPVVANGAERVFLITRSPHRDARGQLIGIVGIGRDITDLRRNEQAVRRERDQLALAARVGGLGIWTYDFAHDAFHGDAQWHVAMGRTPGALIRTARDVRRLVHPDDADRALAILETAPQLGISRDTGGDLYRILASNDDLRWVRSQAAIFAEEDGSFHAIGFVVDVTQSVLAEQRLLDANHSLTEERDTLSERSSILEREAGEDALTGIANRRHLDRALVQACRHAGRTGTPLALAMIDLDHFKSYNDRYGHGGGDEALKVVAGLLASATQRPYDLAARYGGEEFVLLLPGADRPEAVLDAIAERLAALAIPHEASPVSPYLTFSCGCIVTETGCDPVRLLTRADEALYRAKAAGRNRIVTDRVAGDPSPSADRPA